MKKYEYFTPAQTQDHNVVHRLKLTGRGDMQNIIKEAVAIAQERDQPVQFACLGVLITVNPDSPVEPLARDYYRAVDGFIEKDIGPYQDVNLTLEELERDEIILESQRYPAK